MCVLLLCRCSIYKADPRNWRGHPKPIGITMNLGTDSISPEQRVAVSDPRFDMRMTGKLDDESALRSSWIWVAALLLAGMFIVSGYMDDESRRAERKAVSGSDTYASSSSMSSPSTSTLVATSQNSDQRSAKGY